MKAFYGRLASSNPSAALAAAQRAMLASGSPLSHPYHWAPFVLVGEAPVKEPSTNVSAVSVKGR